MVCNVWSNNAGVNLGGDYVFTHATHLSLTHGECLCGQTCVLYLRVGLWTAFDPKLLRRFGAKQCCKELETINNKEGKRQIFPISPGFRIRSKLEKKQIADFKITIFSSLFVPFRFCYHMSCGYKGMRRFWTTLLHATASHLSNMSSEQKNGDLYQSEVERQSGGQRTDKT